MSVPSTTDPAVTKHPAGTTLPAPRARSRARLRAVPDVSRHAEPSVAPPAAVPDVSRHAGPVALRSGLAPPDLTGPSVSPGARPDPTGPSVSPGARPDPTRPSVSPGARPDLGAPATAAGDRAAPAPLTVTIQVDGGPPEVRDRLLAALRDLVATAGDAVAVAGAPEESRPRVARPPVARGGEGLVQLDPQPRAAFRDGRLLELSRLEYDLLLFLARHPRQVFSRGQLLAEVWGHVHAGARTVDVHVSRLRQKLGGHGLIATVRGVGYRLADAAPVRVVPPRAADMS